MSLPKVSDTTAQKGLMIFNELLFKATAVVRVRGSGCNERENMDGTGTPFFYLTSVYLTVML